LQQDFFMMLTRNAYTRVTLALDIVRPIPGGKYKGYHELGAVKHQIDLCDAVSVEESKSDGIECDDSAVPCDGRNVCLKVSRLLKEKFSIGRSVRISIRKRIPVMGGLAGGSADAAATIALLNELWELGLTTRQMIEVGRNVGMDVPYYFIGGTAFDSEAGLQLEPICTGCSFVFVLAYPGFGVSTKEAYAGIDYTAVGRRQELTGRLRKALEKDDMNGVIPLLHNEFELSIFSRIPRLSVIRQELLTAGCSAAQLTGSGSTVIGIARDRVHAEEIGKKISCRTIVSSTLSCQAV
jgi:4-diphosphocytidyl-2-C-methyl-D-erythritol kinase